MKTITALAVVLASLACSTAAQAHTTIVAHQMDAEATEYDPHGTDAQALYQQWINQSAVPTPERVLPVYLRFCDKGHAACTIGVRRIRMRFEDDSYLFTDPQQYPASDRVATRYLFMHEMGHVFDHALRGAGGYRRAFHRAVGHRMGCVNRLKSWSRSWPGCKNGVSESENFAEAYSLCAVSPGQGPWYAPFHDEYEGYGYAVPRWRQLKACAIIRDAAAQAGWS